MEVPVSIPIDTEVTVPFSRTIPISVNIPLVMDVPIDIALDEIPFGDYIHNLSEKLRQAVAE